MTPAKFSRRTWEVLGRSGALLICLVIAVSTSHLDVARDGLLILLGVAVISSVTAQPVWLRYSVILGEAVAAALVVGLAAGPPEVYLTYLLAPALAGALNLRVLGLLTSLGVSTLTLIVVVILKLNSAVPGSVVYLEIWLAIVVAVALTGLAIRYIRSRTASGNTDYATANRLLTSLRDVARQLPNGLDTVSLAETALERLSEVIDLSAAAVYVRTEGDALLPVATTASLTDAWPAAIDRGIWGQAWDTGVSVARSGSFSRPGHGVAAVIPLSLGGRRIGVIACEGSGDLWEPVQLSAAQDIADDTALRIDTARLFAEVQALATAEERRRLSREIHDGVAQEVAALGFLVDAARASTTDPLVSTDLNRIREELTRITTELRLSIFDLRSELGTGMRLGEALAEYARSIGSASGLTVHLVLEESPARLPRSVEVELLRIAQEAITNTRKHAEARTLWVTLRVDPPNAYVRIADDGRGLTGRKGTDHFGLDVMRERSARIGALLTVRPRESGGTIVEATLGVSPKPNAQLP